MRKWWCKAISRLRRLRAWWFLGFEWPLLDPFGAANEVETTAELADSLASSGLELARYLKAVLEGTLLLQGDVRSLSVNGSASELRLTGLEQGVWLVVERTQLHVSLEGEPKQGHWV